MKKARIAVDGAAKGNPGPAGIGVVIRDESGVTLKEIGENIGTATNNAAEYKALIRGLSEALEMGFTHVDVQTDSELMARQISGQYKVRNGGILPLYADVLALTSKFESVRVTHVPRELNKDADRLASRAARPVTGEVQPSLQMREPTKIPPSPPPAREGRMIRRIDVRTSTRVEFVDITREVRDAVKAAGVTDGTCLVYVPHTTAGVTINENADPDVTRDMIDTLERLVPRSGHYRHAEGNADSHVKASLMGFTVNIPVEDGKLALGTWQGIYFCEFDGPRTRHVLVRVG